MLRNEKVVALDEVAELCELNADHFTRFAESADSAELSRLFSELAILHGKQVALLDEQITSMGELPRHPDPDRESLEGLAAWLQTIFAENKREMLIEKAVEKENHIQTAIADALTRQLPEEAIALLHRLKRQVNESLARLKEAGTVQSP